jgi:inorganic pyrophosphatase
MATRTARHAVLSETATFDKKSGYLRVIIETPKGSRNKYDYDPDCDCLELATVLPEGMVFPFDFGFVPSTLRDDGDPLDVLVLMDTAVVPGCVVRTRLVGVIKAKQKEKGKEWIRNDRLIAVAVKAEGHAVARSLADLQPNPVRNIEAFFSQYNRLRSRKFKPIGEGDRQEAEWLTRQGMKAFRNR